MKIAFQEGLYKFHDFGGFLGQLKEWGFDAVEIWGEGLENRLDVVRQQVAASGLPVSSICPGGNGIRGSLLSQDAGERAAAAKDIEGYLEMGAKLGGAGLILVPEFGVKKFMALYPDHSVFTKRKDFFLEQLAPLAEKAVRLGVRILLEPLNRYETFFLLTVGQGAQLCRELNCPAVRVMADLFHMGIEEDNAEQALIDNAEYISHVHLVDSNRKLPGHGDRNFVPLLKALVDNGFDGFLCLECGIPGNPETDIPESLEFIKSLS